MAQERLGGGFLYAYPEYHFQRLSHQAETHIMSAMEDGWPWDVPFYVVSDISTALSRLPICSATIASMLHNSREFTRVYIENFNNVHRVRAVLCVRSVCKLKQLPCFADG